MIKMITAAGRRLDLVHSLVGTMDQGVNIAFVLRIQTDANTWRANRLPQPKLNRSFQRFDNLAGDALRVLDFPDTRQEHDKLIPANPRHRIGCADAALHPPHHFQQHLIPRLMA